MHQRNIKFFPKELRYVGEDKIICKKNIRNVSFDIRFHLLPNTNATKTQDKNSVIIKKNQNKFPQKESSFRPNRPKFATKTQINPNDFEKRKLAEQRATKRLKSDPSVKEDKKLKIGGKKREVKLTVSRALSDEIEARERSLASVKRAREKENKSQN